MNGILNMMMQLQRLVTYRGKFGDDALDIAYIYMEMVEEEAACASSWNDSVRPDDFDEGDYYMGEGEWI